MRLIRRTEGQSTGRHTWVRQSNVCFLVSYTTICGIYKFKTHLNPQLSPLFSVSGHMEVVKLLVSHGAEVTCKDKKAYTPLHAAASSGMISVVKYLLDLGVDVSVNL